MEIFYPGRCPLCGTLYMDTSQACEKCKNELIYVQGPVCYRCGKPLPDATMDFCHDCSNKRVHYERGFALWVYEGPIRESLFQYKYSGQKQFVRFYAKELEMHLGDRLQGLGLDAIIPIPLHKSKKRERGYNQAEILALELSKSLRIPVITDLLARNKKTLPQKALNDKERLFNLREAFSFCDDIYRRYPKQLGTVLLVDDIYTTGSTMEACAKLLQLHNFKKIYFVVLCIGKGM